MNFPDSLGSVNDCYVGQVLEDGHIEQLGILTEMYELWEEVE